MPSARSTKIYGHAEHESGDAWSNTPRIAHAGNQFLQVEGFVT